MEKKISLAVGLHPLMWDFFPFWKYTKKGLIGVFWGKETTSLNGKCLESPPHFFDSLSRWQKRKETFKKNPKILITVTSCSLGKSRSLDKEDGPSNCCTCKISTSITYIQLYQDDHLWKDSLKYAVAVVVQLMAPLLPLRLHLHRGQHTAWGEQSYIFVFFFVGVISRLPEVSKMTSFSWQSS